MSEPLWMYAWKHGMLSKNPSPPMETNPREQTGPVNRHIRATTHASGH